MRRKIIILTFFLLFFGVRPAFAGSVVVNEIMANPPTGEKEWVEFYNPDNIDLTTYWIDDDTDFSSDSGNSSKKQLLSIDISNSTFPVFNLSSHIFNNTCSTSCDYVVLFSSTGIIVDQYQYTTEQIQQQGKSIGRSPDNSNNWTVFDTPTKGSTNNTSVTTSTPNPTSTPSLAPSSSASAFTISNAPSQINSDQLFNVSINLSLSDKPNTQFYLKGAFRHPDKPTNYFGLTKVGSSWIKNSSSSSEQFPITTNSSGNWSGNLEIKPDANDSGFIGSGDYLFKVARYEGSNLTWSNESNIQITAVENTDQGSISSDSSSSTTAPSFSPQSEQPAKSKTASSQSKSYDRLVYHTASVAAATASATPSATTEVKSQKQVNYFNWAGGLMILSGIAVFAFVYLRNNNLREAIFNLFRKRN